MNTVVAVPVAGTTLTVTVTSVPSVVISQLQSLMCTGAMTSKFGAISKLVVGLDVEWNSADVNANPALLQLCSGTRCLIVQLLHMPYIPHELRNFLAQPNTIFVGVGIQADVAKLQASYGLACACYVDLSIEGRGLAQLARDVCGVSILKSGTVARSDWSASALTHEQIAYGAADAYAAYLVGTKLLQAVELPCDQY